VAIDRPGALVVVRATVRAVIDGRGPTRYRSADEDSGRWTGFPFRAGDIVISTRSKTGTTWLQMICAVLVFRSSELPAPLPELSPWLDWLIAPREEVWSCLERQQHRRIIKTHTPLDGIPLVAEADYLVAAREPIDAALSLYHHGGNLDRGRIAALSGQPRVSDRRPPVEEWILDWIEWDGEPAERLDSLVGTIAHLDDAWRRRHERNVTLVRFEDLRADLDGQMRRLADTLHLEVDEQAWPALVDAATFEQMRTRAGLVAPGPPGVLKDPAAFFRSGASGEASRVLGEPVLARYESRLSQLADSGLLAWLRRPAGPSAVRADDR
jgi:aryl sulfotransferase